MRFVIASWFALIAAALATSVSAQPVNGGTLACFPGAPTAEQVGQGLLNGISTAVPPATLDPLNSAWTQKAEPAIEGKTIVLNDQHVPNGCSSDVTDFCLGHLAFSHCSFVFVNMTLAPNPSTGKTLTGLNPVRFKALTVNGVNDRNVSEHTNRGPDASVITDGVFAPEGWDAADPAFVIVLPHNSKQGALVIDLGQATSLCGVASGCNPPKIQADNDDTYHVDYSTDGKAWASLGNFPTTGGSGLHTRVLSGSGFPANFSARYVAVYATSGGNTFAISELQLWDTANKLVTVGKPTVGPVPYEIVDGVLPPTGHSSTDSTVSVVLPHQPGIASALTADIGVDSEGNPRTICGRAMSGCLHEPTIEADNDDTYMLDYSLDGVNWTTYGNYNSDGVWHSATFAPVSGSGLHTRDMSCSARPDTTTACSASNQGPDFKARYFRVYARTGGNTYAVAELELWDAAGNRIPTTPTFTNPQQYATGGYLPYAAGPEPFYTNGQFAPEGTTWNDGHWATTLGVCTATNSCPPAAAGSPPPVSSAKQIDLTADFPIDRMVVQAEGVNHYQVDGWDGTTLTAQGTPAWTSLWTVPPASAGNLRTRSTMKFNVASPHARYVRFYATSGNGDYSLSELQVFTPQGNSAGTYGDTTATLEPQLDSQGFPYSDGRANDGQGFACSYDGAFNTTLASATEGGTNTYSELPIEFYVSSVQLRAHCVTDTDSGDYTIASATNRQCSMTLVPPKGYGSEPFTDTFQAGQCASPESRAIMSYMRYDEASADGDNSAVQFASKDDVSPDPNSSDLTCSDWSSLDAHIPDVLRGFVPPVAAQAARKAINAVLDFHNAPGNLIPFPVVATGLQPPNPATMPVQCDGNLSLGEPPTAEPDNLRGIAGKATQVGSGSESATLRITGSFTVDQAVSLDRASLAVDALLQEVGVGELVEGPDGGAILLPIGLEAQNGAKPNKGMFQTPPGAKPLVSARIDAQGGSMSFEIDVQKAAIAEPDACLKGSPDALLKTSFTLVGGSTDSITLHGATKWLCQGAQLVAP